MEIPHQTPLTKIYEKVMVVYFYRTNFGILFFSSFSLCLYIIKKAIFFLFFFGGGGKCEGEGGAVLSNYFRNCNQTKKHILVLIVILFIAEQEIYNSIFYVMACPEYDYSRVVRKNSNNG